MASIEEYISGLDNLALDLDSIIEDTVVKNEGFLLSKIKLRLFNTGRDADGKSLRPYSPKTVEIKRKKGQRASFVTLRDTGDWYKSMFITYKNQQIIVDAGDPKTDVLIDIYGEAILELSENEINEFIDTKVEKAITDALNKLPSIDLGEL